MPKPIGNKIIDLLGREFRVGDWEFFIDPLRNIPYPYKPCLSRDRLSDTVIAIYYSPDLSDWVMQTYSHELNMWVRYKLTYIRYIPEKDMRNIRV